MKPIQVVVVRELFCEAKPSNSREAKDRRGRAESCLNPKGLERGVGDITAHYWTHAATPGRPLRALDHATPERHLIREMKSRKNKMFLPRLDPQGSVPCRLYPAIRDHPGVLAVQEWLVAVEGLNSATKLVKENLPQGTELRLLMTELLGFTKRSRHRVGLAVVEVTDQT